MCDPVTAMVVMAAGSAGADAYSSYTETLAQNQANEYNANLMESNAKISDYQASQATQRGLTETGQQLSQTRGLIGTQRAAYGTSGVQIGTGSPASIISNTSNLGQQDALTIRNNAAMEAFGYKTESYNRRSKAGLLRQSNRDPLLAGGTSLLSGLTDAAKLATMGG